MSCCSPLEAERFARILLASYPNSTPTDKEAYIALIQTIFQQYETDLVRKAVSPSGIPYEVNKFLPTMGEIEKYLSGKRDYLDRVDRMKALPLPTPVFKAAAPAAPNLFVGSDVPGYADAEDFTKVAHERFYRREKDHVCYDGRLIDGIWVPNSWWEVRHSKTYEQWRESLNLRPQAKREELTEAQKKAALDDAAKVGKEIAGMKLSAATLEVLNRLREG